MSEGEICDVSSSSDSHCCCSGNGDELCECEESETEAQDDDNKEIEKYWNGSEQLDNNTEEIMKAAFDLHLSLSDSDESIKRPCSDDDQTDSVTEVTENTTPSDLPVTDYDKPYLSSFFDSEKYTKTKVRTFRKTGERTFKIEASSAINRRKKQFEIDRQNMIILRKLKEVKPVVVLPK